MLGETTEIPSKAIEVEEAQIHGPEPLIAPVEEISIINSNIAEVPVANIDLVPTVSVPINLEEVLEVNERDKETLTNSLPSSTPIPEIIPQVVEVSNIPEESNHTKKVTEEELKPGNAFLLIIVETLNF